MVKLVYENISSLIRCICLSDRAKDAILPANDFGEVLEVQIVRFYGVQSDLDKRYLAETDAFQVEIFHEFMASYDDGVSMRLRLPLTQKGTLLQVMQGFVSCLASCHRKFVFVAMD